MEPVTPLLPNDVLIVEDDAIIALDFEDTLLGFGVKTVRTAGSVARAMRLIDDRAPDFALLDVGLAGGKSLSSTSSTHAYWTTSRISMSWAGMPGHAANAWAWPWLNERNCCAPSVKNWPA